MPNHFKVDHLLSDAHLMEFQQLAAARSTTIDALWIWTRTHGYKISRAAVSNWRQHYRRLLNDPVLQMRSALLLHVQTLPPAGLRQLYATAIGVPPP